MNIIRIYFAKKDEAAYISHLDLQRVVARAIRKSGVPAWFSEGFNPHIYMSFLLPLPIMHQSEVEMVDFKTEKDEDFAKYIEPLNASLPRGISVYKIDKPLHAISQLACAEYRVNYLSEVSSENVAAAVNAYNNALVVMVTRKTKRSEFKENLKEVLPNIRYGKNGEIRFSLPAGEVTYNPNILLNYFNENNKLDSTCASIMREKIFAVDGSAFA